MTAAALAPPARSDAANWVPLPMQRAALACGAYELFLGGAAGPGKSEYLVVAPLRWVHEPSFRGVLFRNSFPELQRTLIDKSWRFYPAKGGDYNATKHAWEFPSGATIEFAYLESDRDVHRYQGAEFQFAGFDELPHFSEYQYRYLTSRLRSAAGVPIRLRATGNPDGPHLEWVRARFADWIDHRAAAGEVLWYDPEGKRVPRGTPDALSRCYIPGRLADNPHVGPEYRTRLLALDPVTRARLLEGDWDAAYGEGKLFHRTWWARLDGVPRFVAAARAWDLGAGGDPTEGVLVGDRGAGVVPRFVVADVVSHVGPPHEVHALIAATAAQDGPAVTVVIPQDPGQAGVDQARTFARELAGYDVRLRRPTGDKTTRALPFSAQVGARNVALAPGPWVAGYVAQLHAFPDGARDDKVDASADAFAALVDAPTWAADEPFEM